ncbi:hypothetical protein [Acidovorax radicis]|uniref:hypothetical protein n=1 Tax=Acidovorax radicis TaxID=758826 RepID=UPI0039AE999D
MLNFSVTQIRIPDTFGLALQASMQSLERGYFFMSFKKLVAAALFMGAGLAHAFAPQAGTWVVTSEVDGKPGRGFGIDVQNTTLVMQMYAYESTGQATFYLAVGDVADNKVNTPLTKYTGGRHFGSGARSGTAAGSPGNVNIRFTSGTTGFITFPNEGEVAISRFNFGYGAVADSLRGFWTFNSIGSEGLQSDLVELSKNLGATANGNGLMSNANELFGCEHQVRGSMAGTVLCVKISSGGQLLRSYSLVYSVNEGEGYSQATATSAQQMLQVRRLTTPQGVGTGLVYKDSELGAGNSSLLHHIEQISNFGLPQ